MQRAQTIAQRLRGASGVQNVYRQAGFGESSAVMETGIETAFGVRHASRQILQQRMKSVGNIQKITAAMKMVASSRLRGAQARAFNSRGIWQPMVKLLGEAPDVDVPKNLTIAVSSDRGLCGGINSNIAKVVRGTMGVLDKLGEEGGEPKEKKLVIIGDKARGLLLREYGSQFELYITDTAKSPTTFTTVAMITDEILKQYEFDTARIIYNRFRSAISFVPSMITVNSPEVTEKRSEGGGLLDAYEWEDDDKTSTLKDLSEFQLATSLYNAMMENYCSELGSRMSAMENSTNNARDMKDKLTLLFNRSRQAAITTELIEIISGASALEG